MDLGRIADVAFRLCASKGWGAPTYIDAGNSAAVYAVERPKGPAALKIYDPVFFEGENALIEAKRIALQEQLKGHGCPHLIDIFESGQLPEDGTWYLLMEYCPWPSLEKQLRLIPLRPGAPVVVARGVASW